MNFLRQVGMDAAYSSAKTTFSKNNIRMYTDAASTKAPNVSPLNRKLAQAAFSLVEVTMALGLMSFCLVAMLGMLPVGLNQERSASEQLAATQLITAVESDFQNSPITDEQTKKYEIKTTVGPTRSFFVSPSGDLSLQQAGAAYRVWYDVSEVGNDQTSRQIHLYVTRAQATELAQRSVVAEGIVRN